jgi:hypothetical protein
MLPQMENKKVTSVCLLQTENFHLFAANKTENGIFYLDGKQ